MFKTKIICWQRKSDDVGAKIIIPKKILALLDITKDDNYINYYCTNNSIILLKSNEGEYLTNYKRTILKEKDVIYSGKLVYIKSTNDCAAGCFYIPKAYDEYLGFNRESILDNKEERTEIDIFILDDKLILKF